MAGILPAASCLKHHLYVGNLYGPSRLHALEFDDETLTFVKTNEITADAPHAWITFNVCDYVSPFASGPGLT
jgi:hypothetical protein